jgi:hypothetical protein
MAIAAKKEIKASGMFRLLQITFATCKQKYDSTSTFEYFEVVDLNSLYEA